MVDRILAATPLSHNDISSLALLFQRAFHYHHQHRSQFNETHGRIFLENVRTIVGLSFTATLVNGDLLEMFDSYLIIFIQYQAFLNPYSQHTELAKAFANMVALGSDFFRCLGHPRYYDDFLLALRNCITHITKEIRVAAPAKAGNVIGLIMA